MTGRLEDMVAVVTGGESGIGQAVAVAFAREGADVALTFFEDEDAAGETRRGVEDAGREALVQRTDVSDEDDVDRLFTRAAERFGALDVLVNVAGVDLSGTPVAELDTETWHTTLRTNLDGPFFCCRAFVRHRAEQGGGGVIVNVTSVHEEAGRAGGAAYDASKGGLRNLTRSLALEVASEGIRVNNLAPGMILTPINQEAIDDPDVREEKTANIPLSRAGTPEDVAHAAVFLASAESAYVTGASLFVDGGLLRNLGQGA